MIVETSTVVGDYEITLTLANQITIARIVLVPIFAGFAVAHGLELRDTAVQGVTFYHIAAVLTYGIAALGDALDGWVARRFDQRTQLGATLDPFADKFLLITGVVVLTLSPWPAPLPLWFGGLIILRDVLIIIGYFIVKYFAGRVEMYPHWTSKVCTVLQMCCVAWILIDFRHVPVSPSWLIYGAALFTLISAVYYYFEARRQILNRSTVVSV